MALDKINQSFSSIAMSEMDELIVIKRRAKKKEEAVVVSEKNREDAMAALFDELPAPELPDLQAIRQKIMNNEYQIDYEKLAEKMIQLEKLWIE